MPRPKINFTQEDFERIINSQDNLSDVSKQNYISKMKILTNLTGKNIRTTLTSLDKTVELIKRKYKEDRTIAAYLATLSAGYKYLPGYIKKFPEEHKKITDEYKIIKEKIQKKVNTNVPSKKQQQGFMKLEEMIPYRDKLPINSIERLLLEFYTRSPMRADLNNVEIFSSEPEGNIKETGNYLILNNNRAILVLNEYKTSKTYGKIVRELDPVTFNVLKHNLKSQPRKYLFVDSKGNPFVKENSFVKWANRTFLKVLEKPMTISLMRHSYISSMDMNKISICDREKVAGQMMHSVKQQEEYRFITK